MRARQGREAVRRGALELLFRRCCFFSSPHLANGSGQLKVVVLLCQLLPRLVELLCGKRGQEGQGEGEEGKLKAESLALRAFLEMRVR